MTEVTCLLMACGPSDRWWAVQYVMVVVILLGCILAVMVTRDEDP